MSGNVTFVVQTTEKQMSEGQMCPDPYVLQPDVLIHIRNITQTEKVLGMKNYDKVILDDLKENRKEQLWKIGACDKDGYFTLENSNVPKFMTAISSTSLEIKGKISLRSITGWLTKGQLISKANCQAVNSSKKQTNDFVSTKGH